MICLRKSIVAFAGWCGSACGFGRSDKLRQSILDDVSAMLEQLRQEQWTSHNDILSQSRDELDEFRSALSKLEDKASQSENNLVALGQRLTELTCLQEQVAQLARTGEELRADLRETEDRLSNEYSKQLRENINVLQNDLAALRKEYADFSRGIANDHASRNQDIAASHEQLTNNLAALHQEYSNFSNGTSNELAVLRERDDALRQDLANIHNELLNTCEVLGQSLDNFKAKIQLRLSTELSLTKHWILSQRTLLAGPAGRVARSAKKGSCAARAKGKSIQECYQELGVMAPKACKKWRQLVDVNAESYEGLPADSCSVKGHPMAELFRYFLTPYLIGGTVLDIGCGPQPMPSYLDGYPTALIAGIDPVPPKSKHPFQYVHGTAEFLPWKNGDFNTVIAATSLDHVLLPDRVFEEIYRVLRPGGRFIIWTSFVEGAKKYDPYSVDIKPVDKYHLFHFGREWFEEMLGVHFRIEEAVHMEFPGAGSFYSCAPRQENKAIPEKDN